MRPSAETENVFSQGLQTAAAFAPLSPCPGKPGRLFTHRFESLLLSRDSFCAVLPTITIPDHLSGKHRRANMIESRRPARGYRRARQRTRGVSLSLRALIKSGKRRQAEPGDETKQHSTKNKQRPFVSHPRRPSLFYYECLFLLDDAGCAVLYHRLTRALLIPERLPRAELGKQCGNDVTAGGDA